MIGGYRPFFVLEIRREFFNKENYMQKKKYSENNKKTEQKQIEVLAPAGSYEGLIQNLEYGADAVYVGGKSFGARAYAQNLSQEELCQAIDEAHIRRKKIYLTVNTLLKNGELEGSLYDYLEPLYRQGLDAVIVQDFGVFRFIKREFPGMAIHASTQMTVTGYQGAKLLQEAGTSRIVTARELSLEEIRKIREHSPIEIEAFVHGALCYSYSGQCLFSSLLGGRSGNRGRCAQPCRLPYQAAFEGRKLSPRKESCPLSLKDMNAITILPEIIEAGVTSLKIEGRMKQASYGAGVTNLYREYVDRYLEDPDHYFVREEDLRELEALFGRGGFTKGYYEMRNGRQMLDLANDKKMGERKRQLQKKKEKIKGNFILSEGKSAILELDYGDVHVRAEGEPAAAALNQPLSEEKIRQQLQKTGATPYDLESLKLSVEGAVFLPLKALNELRRQALEQLEQTLKESARRSLPERAAAQEEISSAAGSKLHTEAPSFVASCETKEQFAVLEKTPGISFIYVGWQIAGDVFASERNKDCGLMLPHVMRAQDEKKLQPLLDFVLDRGCRKILVRNLEQLAWLKAQKLEALCTADASLYCFNDESTLFLRELGVAETTAPLELNERELRSKKLQNEEMLLYGYLPMMVSAQCVQKNLDKCRKNNGLLTLRDRFGKHFFVKCTCDFCYNVIYNSLPYGVFDRLDRLSSMGFSSYRFQFTMEGAEEVKKILRDGFAFAEGRKPACDYEMTKGHLKRGVE